MLLQTLNKKILAFMDEKQESYQKGESEKLH